ncbi:G2/M phase-specific E3 ubiquitin-protein ligase-like [Cyrtonyx montezumae]|uniref:G2/M phase-specific E3 ubiquitin-protein ligase-like n=1 Tax=Cyrtonyx montezumae TaxID=9017 RepID=UPI0032DAFB97
MAPQARKHCGGVRRVDASPSAFSSANTPGSSGAASGTGPLTLRWLQEPPPSCLGAQGPELSSWEVWHRSVWRRKPGAAGTGTPRVLIVMYRRTKPAKNKRPARLWYPGEECTLCGQGNADKDMYGRKVMMHGIHFHEFCVAFSSGIFQKAWIENRIECLSLPDVIQATRQAEQTNCFVCGKRGASITCAQAGCDRSFHLPCASEGECVTQYFDEFRSFCGEHRPQQAVKSVPGQKTPCIICTDLVSCSVSYGIMGCPSCHRSWFHRACVQRLALRAGITVHCPLCKDNNEFFDDLRILGIQIPFRGPMQDNNQCAPKGDRQKRCSARECRYPQGRERAGTEGPWELLLCSSCAAHGTHRRCSNLRSRTSTWECNTCAGEGTSSSSNLDSASPSIASQQGLGPSQGSEAMQLSTSSSSSRSPPGPAHNSQLPESSGLSSPHGIERRRISSPSLQDETTSNEPQKRRGSCHNAALTAPDSASQGTSLPTRPSRAVVYNLRSRTRSCFPLRCQTPDSPSRPRTRRGSGHRATPSAESGTHSCTRRGARQAGRARTRSCSPHEQRAAESQSRTQRGRRSQSRRRSRSQVLPPLLALARKKSSFLGTVQ